MKIIIDIPEDMLEKYKSHYATILSWGRRREKEKPRGESKAFKGEMSTRDYNFDELEKKLIKN